MLLKNPFLQFFLNKEGGTPYLDLADIATRIHVIVTFRLEYCNAFYMGLLLRSAQRITQLSYYQ